VAPALVALTLALAGGAGSAAGGVFRCVEADGGVRFVDSPHACPRGAAEAHDLGRVERIPAAPAAPGDERGPERARSPGAIWLRAAEIGAGWEVVREAPIDPAGDPDLVAWGVRAQDARHYTRDMAGTVQVCSVELWSFASVAQARAAHEGFAHPGWRIERVEDRLLMLRGLTLAPGSPPRRGVFADCRGIGDRIRLRAAPDEDAP
jgi:hypothetical protein